MNLISVQEIQQDPTGFLKRVAAGDSLLLTSAGSPVAEIKQLFTPSAGPRPFGLAAGEFSVPGDFDDPLPEAILREFEGR